MTDPKIVHPTSEDGIDLLNHFSHWLMARTDLDLLVVIALDKVQKGIPISEDEFRSLKAKKLVEGRRPNLFVSAAIAAATETQADYIKKRAFDKDHYKKMVVAYLLITGARPLVELLGWEPHRQLRPVDEHAERVARQRRSGRSMKP